MGQQDVRSQLSSINGGARPPPLMVPGVGLKDEAILLTRRPPLHPWPAAPGPGSPAQSSSPQPPCGDIRGAKAGRMGTAGTVRRSRHSGHGRHAAA